MTDSRPLPASVEYLISNMTAIAETVLWHGTPMDWDEALRQAARSQGVPIQDMRYALINALSEKWLASTRLWSGDLSIPEPTHGSYHTAGCSVLVPHVAHRHNGGTYDRDGYELCSGIEAPPPPPSTEELLLKAQKLIEMALKQLKKD